MVPLTLVGFGFHQQLYNCLLGSGTTDSGYLNRMNRLDNSLLKHSLRLISDSLWWLITPSIHSLLITILPLKNGKTISLSTDSRRVQPGNRSGTSLSSTSRIDNIRAKKRSPPSPSPDCPRLLSPDSKFRPEFHVLRSGRYPTIPVEYSLSRKFMREGGVLHALEMNLLGSDWLVTYRSGTFCVGTMGKSLWGMGMTVQSTPYVRWQWLDRAVV
jgi:hypothetical protein